MTVVKIQKHSIGPNMQKLKKFLEEHGYTVSLQPKLNAKKDKIILVVKKGNRKLAEAHTAKRIHVFSEDALLELQIVLSSFKVKGGEINLHKFELK